MENRATSGGVASGQKVRDLLLDDRFILVVILVNALVIFFEGFDPGLAWLEHIDNALTLVFLTEAIVKIRAWGVKPYFQSSWNIFDFSLVVLAMPSLIAWLLPVSIPSLDFLLVLRIMRIFKFFRFIRFVPKIDHIIAGVSRAAKASVVIIFVFFIFNFTVALVSCFLFREMAPEYFADPLISLYSIFKVFTVEGWYDIPDDMVADSGAGITFFVRIYFVMILFFGGIFGLSLVNSIFVDTMVSDNTDELEAKVSQLEAKIDELLKLQSQREQ